MGTDGRRGARRRRTDTDEPVAAATGLRRPPIYGPVRAAAPTAQTAQGPPARGQTRQVRGTGSGGRGVPAPVSGGRGRRPNAAGQPAGTPVRAPARHRKDTATAAVGLDFRTPAVRGSPATAQPPPSPPPSPSGQTDAARRAPGLPAAGAIPATASQPSEAAPTASRTRAAPVRPLRRRTTGHPVHSSTVPVQPAGAADRASTPVGAGRVRPGVSVQQTDQAARARRSAPPPGIGPTSAAGRQWRRQQ